MSILHTKKNMYCIFLKNQIVLLYASFALFLSLSLSLSVPFKNGLVTVGVGAVAVAAFSVVYNCAVFLLCFFLNKMCYHFILSF